MVVPGTTKMLNWSAHGLSDRGRQRPRNEDALLVAPESGICAVADGMGGHAAGDVASRLAVEALAAAFQRPAAGAEPGPDTLTELLVEAFHAANQAILGHAAADLACHGMGTTMTVLAGLTGTPVVVLAHIGDSRAYRLREGRLEQLTRDHTWVQQQVDAGMLTPLQARHHRRASMLNRVLGTDAAAPADTAILDAEPGDLLLLCSDGLTAVLEDDDVRGILDVASPLQQRAEALIHLANERGGPDNITVVLAAAEAA
jgi:PPM family protein phosphatase